MHVKKKCVLSAIHMPVDAHRGTYLCTDTHTQTKRWNVCSQIYSPMGGHFKTQHNNSSLGKINMLGFVMIKPEKTLENRSAPKAHSEKERDCI